MWINRTLHYFGKIKSHHKTEHLNDGGSVKKIEFTKYFSMLFNKTRLLVWLNS